MTNVIGISNWRTGVILHIYTMGNLYIHVYIYALWANGDTHACIFQGEPSSLL